MTLWDKLKGIAATQRATDLAVSAGVPKSEAKSPRYKLSANYQPKPPAISFEAPAGIPKAEWAEAQRNVAFGSAPSTIPAGSDIPSDFTLRRNGLSSS